MARRTEAVDLDAIWAAIDAERLSLADLLADLTAAEWDQPSLCAGWRVRDVAAHLALSHTGPRRLATDMLRARLDFNRMTHDAARRHAEVPTAQLIEELRAMAGSRRRAPGVSPLEPLVDVLVHGQDIAIPLGRQRMMPVDAAALAATRVWSMRWPMTSAFRHRDRWRHVQLVATDTAWTAGSGPAVQGSIAALLLLMAGRTAALDQLAGPGAPDLFATTADT